MENAKIMKFKRGSCVGNLFLSEIHKIITWILSRISDFILLFSFQMTGAAMNVSKKLQINAFIHNVSLVYP